LTPRRKPRRSFLVKLICRVCRVSYINGTSAQVSVARAHFDSFTYRDLMR
jgi:hypothetical protein